MSCTVNIVDNRWKILHRSARAVGQDRMTNPPVIDNGGLGWGLLGCCVPVAGLVLYLVWKDTKPNTAKAAGIGALVSVVLAVLYYLFIILSAVTYGVFS